jgi:hypothetical protein
VGHHVALTRLLALVVVLAPALARAQDAPADAGVPDAPAPPPPQPQQDFEPPHAIGSTDIAAPPDAPPITANVVVTVKLLVDATGAVKKVDLVTAPQPPFDDAVIVAVK